MRIFKALLIAAVAVCSSTASAHQDRIVTIGRDGTLVEIPPKYGPAKLEVDFSANGDKAPVQSVVLRLGGKQTALPRCVTGLLRSRSAADLEASASWYHDEFSLPYYINILFLDPGHKPNSWTNPGYAMLFNLRTGKLIKMDAHVPGDNGTSIQYVPVNLASRCPASVLEGVLDFGRK